MHVTEEQTKQTGLGEITSAQKSCFSVMPYIYKNAQYKKKKQQVQPNSTQYTHRRAQFCNSG